MSTEPKRAAQTVVVLGGGVGGVAAANRRRRRLDRRHRVVLVNRDPDFSFAASYWWVMSGQRSAKQVTRPLSSLERRGIQVLVGADNIADSIDGRPTAARFDGHGDCFIEAGFGKAGYGSGDFYAEPSPAVTLRRPSRRMHLGKVALEQNVMRRSL